MISYKNMRFRFGCFLFDLKSFCHFKLTKIQSNQFKNQSDIIFRTHLKER